MRDFSPAPCGDAGKGDILFLEREYPPYTPKRKDEGEPPSTPALLVGRLKSCGACRIRRLPGVGAIRLGLLLSSLPLCLRVAILTQSPSTIDLCNLVIACQCGRANARRQKCVVITVYRQSPQCGERSNAAFGKQSAAKQTSHAPHDSKARLRVVTNCRRFMAKPCTPHPHCAACAVIQAANCQCAGSRGKAPCLSLGVPKGVFSLEREHPL